MPTQELNIFQYPHNLRNRVKLIREFPDKPILSQNKDVHEYVSAVFDSTEQSDIYVKHYERPLEGSGAHFDVYNHTGEQLLHEEFPFIATYNTWGKSVIRATVLGELIKKDYDTRFPEQNKQAHDIRRHLGTYALSDPNATIYTHHSTLDKGSGIIIPQVPNGPYVVHEVSPAVRARHILRGISSGAFLKFLVPADNDNAREKLRKLGYKPFEGYEEGYQQLQELLLDKFDTPYMHDGYDDYDDENTSRGLWGIDDDFDRALD